MLQDTHVVQIVEVCLLIHLASVAAAQDIIKNSQASHPQLYAALSFYLSMLNSNYLL